MEYKETRSCNVGRTSKNYVIAKRREYNNDAWANDNIPFQRIVGRSVDGWAVRAGQGMHRSRRGEGEARGERVKGRT